MRHQLRLLLFLVPLLAFVAIELGGCGSSSEKQGPTDTPTPNITNESPTPLTQDTWFKVLGKYIHEMRRVHDELGDKHPDYTSKADVTATYAQEFSDVAAGDFSAIGQLSPVPPGAQPLLDALMTKLRALLDAFQVYPPSAPAMDAAYDAYVGACEDLQQYAAANNIDVDLRCSGPIPPLSAGDFFAAIAPAIATMHAKADAAQAKFDALTPAQQAGYSTLSTYIGGISSAYGTAVRDVGDPAAPTANETAKQAFLDAAGAVSHGALFLDAQVKSTTNLVDLPALVPTITATLAPLFAAVEQACAGLQTAATTAGVTTQLGCR